MNPRHGAGCQPTGVPTDARSPPDRDGTAMSDAVLVDRRDGLVTVTFNRPHKKNALNASSWNQLDAVLTEVEVEPADRALVLTGSGGSFSSGADLSGGMDDGKGSSGGEKKGGQDKGGL